MNGPAAPPAVRVTPYGVFTLPDGSVYSVVWNNGVTSSVSCRAPKFAGFAGSAARTTKVYRPAAVGVPLRMPSVENVRPGGIVPSAIDHANDGRQQADSWKK